MKLDGTLSREATFAAAQHTKERDYWLKKLSGELIKSHFPFDHKENVNKSHLRRLDTETFRIPGDALPRLIQLSNNSESRVYIILVTVLILLLDKYTNNHHKDFIVGTPVYRQDLEGDFINSVLVLRNQFNDHMTFKELLLSVKQTIVEANENQNYPIETLLYKLNIPFSQKDDFPLFDIGILHESIHDKRYFKNFNLNMIFSFSRTAEYMQGVVDYNSALYNKTTIQAIIRHFNLLLHQVLFDVDRQIASIDILTVKEKKQLADFNHTQALYPKEKTIHELFETQVEQTPDSTALQYEDKWLTYRELNKKANQLAHILRRKGVKPGTIVGLMVEPSLSMVIGILGILKAGGTYLPIDEATPRNRIITMLEDSRASLLLTDSTVVRNEFFTAFQSFELSNKSLHISAWRPQIRNLDMLPIPDRSLVNYEKSTRFIGQAMVKNSMSLQTTRGCPYNCAYCHKIWPKNHVFRSAQHIFDEVRVLHDMGVKRFAFVDDIFNLNKENSMRFFELIIKHQLDVQLFFPNGMRGDLLTPEYIDLLVEAGTTGIALALETGSPRIQKLIKKNLNIKKLGENIDYFCKKYPNVILELFTMHGFPTETEEEAMMTLNFIKRVKWLHFPYINILKIYPNTDMMKLALENGISREAISRSDSLAHHQLSETLPFDREFTLKYQTDFLNNYFLSKERLIYVLPYQMEALTEDEILQKYNSYLPVDITRFPQLLEFFEITELIGVHKCADEERFFIPGLNEKLKHHFQQPQPAKGALKFLLLDLSQFFNSEGTAIYDVVEPPLGPMYVMTYLNQQFGSKINGKIYKSRMDFDNYEELKALLDEFNPDVIGIRTIIFYKEFFHRSAAMIRSWGIDVPIIAGGPYATSSYETILQDRNIDLVVIGEGEITIAEVLGKMWENDGKLPDEKVLKEIPGVVFVTSTASSKRKYGREILLLDGLASPMAREPDHNLDPINKPEDLAYIIFTSGSTGIPKGVLVKHQGLVNYINWAAKHYVKNDHVNFPLYTSISFDLTVTSLFTPLVTGNRVVVYGGEHKELQIEKIVSDNRVQVVKLTPSHLKLIRDKKMEKGTSPVKCFIVGGEDLESGLARQIHENYNGNVKIFNEYGPTETVVGSMIHQFMPEKNNGKSVPIGIPIDNTQIYVLDINQNPLPPGALGEIYISGDGVARGYLNRPELTRERFCKNPFIPGERMYKTGDLARRLPHGDIEFIGRVDQQLKIRGFRIEVGEIENQLLKHHGVNEVLVIPRERITYDESIEKYLCAYIVPGSKVEISQLRDYLAMNMPDYMIPSCFVLLEKIPLTPNGKIDRKALPAPESGVVGTEYATPRNEIDRKLVEIWIDLLKIPKNLLGIDHDFFALGGHSLSATIMIAKIYKELDVKVSLAEIFKVPTIRGISRFIKEAALEKYTPIEPGEKKEYYPLSSAQKRLFIIRQMANIGTVYNIPTVFLVQGGLKKEKWEYFFRKLIDRHESLRTSFELVEGEPVQKVNHMVEFKIEYYEMKEVEVNVKVEEERSSLLEGTRGLAPLPLEPAARSPQQAATIISSFMRPFDLSRAPLLRLGLIKIEEKKHILMMDMHHIISDGTSRGIFIKDTLALYNDRELPAIRIQYRDFSQWQNRLLTSEKIKKQEEYWLNRFKDIVPVLNIPTDYPRSLTRRFTGDIIRFKIEKEITKKIKKFEKETETTLYMILLAVFNILLAKYSEQEDIVVGTSISGRTHPDLGNIIGMFVNMLSMRNHPKPHQSFLEFLKEVKENALAAFENQDYQFDQLVASLNLQGNTAGNPLFNVVFVLQNLIDAPTDFHFPGYKDDLKLYPYEYENPVAKFDLLLVASEDNNNIRLDLEYSTELFQERTIQKIAKYYVDILKQVLENEHIQIKDIAISHDLMEISSTILEHDQGEFHF